MSSLKNGSITNWFKPKGAAPTSSQASKATQPPAKRLRSAGDDRWPSPSPSPSPPTLAGSAENPPPTVKDNAVDMNASFSSMLSTSSKRMVTSSGQEVVRGSDTETDEDLEDLDTILSKSRVKPKPKVKAPAAAASPAPNTLRIGNAAAIKSQTKKRDQKDYGAFSLGNLVADHKRQVAMEVRIAEAQANLHEASTEAAVAAAASSASPKKDAIKAVLVETNDAEDGGKARRVMDALQRTEAFERSDVWHFFTPQPTAPPRNPFPLISHPMLKQTLNDPDRRRHALVSGFVQRVAQKVPLPDELLLWMMTEVCRETRDDLLEAYIETLHHAAASTSECLSPENLTRCFRMVGVKPDALDFRGPIQQSRESIKAGTNSLSPNLSPFIDLLGKIGDRMPQASRDLAVHFLVRASFDQTVLLNNDIGLCIEKSLKALLESYPTGPELNAAFSRLTVAIFDSLKSTTLRQKLVSALPRSKLVTHNFRRRLALAFTLDKSRYLDASLENPALTARLLLLFEKGAALRITPDTDYVALKARLSMLNVALDAGFSDFEFLDHGGSGVDTQAEKRFNESIDALTNAVRDLTARIVDAGAAHMSRTEAKVMAEMVAQRLEFQVRTKEKPPRDWFGEHERREKEEFMRGYLSKKKEEQGVKTEQNQPAVAIEDELKIKDEQVGATKKPGIKEGITTTTTSTSATESEQKPNTQATVEKKVAIRSSTVSPIAKKGKNRMLMMRLL